MGLPSGLPWTSGSQRVSQVDVWHGQWRCGGCCGAEGHCSSCNGPPWALDPDDGQALAALSAGPVESWPVKAENSDGAWRGHAGPGERWRPQPTQGQRAEGGVKHARLNNLLVCLCTGCGIFLSHPEFESNMRYCSRVQCNDWVRGKPGILLLRICYCSANEGEKCIYVSGRLGNMRQRNVSPQPYLVIWIKYFEIITKWLLENGCL